MEEIPGQPPGDVTNPVSSGIKTTYQPQLVQVFFFYQR